MASDPLIAAFDLGTSAAKGILVAPDGRIVHEETRAYATAHPAAGHVEQAPDDWWDALCALAQQFWRAGWASESVAAVALTGQMQDLIAIDGERRPLGPAILYSDARAGDEAAQARDTLRAHGATDAELAHLDAASPLAKILWLRRQQPQRLDACAGLLFNAKDYALLRLTGAATTDPTTAATTSLYDPRTGDWRGDRCDLLDVPRAWLPPIRTAGQIVGTVSAAAATATGFAQRTPVCCGMGDAAAATLAAGLTTPGGAYLYMGTTGWAATLTASAAPGADGAALWRLPYVIAGSDVTIAPLLNAGNVRRWIMDVLEMKDPGGAYDDERFERLLRETPERSGGAIFLPYLHGERFPVYEPRALGTFIRLGPATGRGALAWAVLEGICLAMRQVLDALGPMPDAIRVVGGMARSPAVRQLLADVCGARVGVPALPDAASALAAAIPAAVALGLYPDVPAAVDTWLPPARITAETQPDPLWSERYQATCQTYRELYPLIARIT